MGGRNKGGSSHTPIEAKETGRSFQIARILEVLSEGEIYGFVDDMCSVYLDKTPLQNKNGTFNFKNVSVYGNAGTQDQDVLKEFSAVEKEVNVNAKILKNKPVIKTVIDTNVTRIRMTLGVERLIQQEDNGDTNGTSVTMTVQIIKNDRIYSSKDYTFVGKYSNPYREMFDLNVPQAPFQIKVIRVQPDSDTNKLQNNCFWSSYTEIIDKAFAYPNTALVGIKIDSEYFNDIPERNYEIYGLIVKVPSNYDAFEHTYTSDFWDGSFKLSWTNNPAWIFYDLVTNTRYGMGQRLQDFGIDKWQLYAIGRYCDELVPDGFGGREPRMTCNIWITDQRKAYDLINDICSIFRAMPVWNGQALTAIQDRASDPVWTYNNANTIGGFTRQRSAKKARHNTIQVEYIDADDFYEKKIESVSDDALVARYGQNVKKVTAFGCTSRGQAYRTGRWLLETEKLETETITFTVGQEGVMHLPYDVIEVADSQYTGLNVGGRILAINGTRVTLDRTIEIDDQSYLSYVSKQAITENVKIVSFDKKTNIATLAKDVSGTPELTVWGLTTKRISTGLYRAISIKENDNSEGKTYTITALQHVPEKEDIVINGTHFDPKPQTIYGDVVDADIKYNGTKLTVSGKVNGSYNVLSAKQITSYNVKLLKGGALAYIEKGLKSPDIDVDNLENGNYEAQISAYNEKGQLLNQYTKTFVINRPPLVTGINVAGHFTSIVLTWNLIDDFTETEIWVSGTDDINTARLVERVTGCYYSHEVGAKQIRYYWLKHKRGVNVGSFDQLQGRKGESGVDINAELEVLNKELSRNIIDEVFDTAMPARKLEMIKTVARIDNPTENIGHNQVYNEADGKLYVWDGRKYTAKVQAVDLEGKLASSQLDQALINQLTTASSTANNALSKANTVQSALAQEVNQRTQAIQAETRARTTAISAEATARTQALQAEANARGTAVSRLEQADREKAQLIATTTAKADNALSGLSEERQARIAADNAESQARTALTARVANTEGSVTTLSQSLSTHTRNLSEITQSLNSRVGGINLFSVVNARLDSIGETLVTRTVISEKDEHFKLVIKNTGVFNIRIDNTLKAYLPTLKLGDKYVLSLQIKASKVGRLARIGVELGGYDSVSESLNVDVNLDWRVIEVPAVVSSTHQQLYQYLLLRFENWQVDDWVEIQNVQLQRGEKATAFSRSSLLTQAELTNHKSTQAEVNRVQSEQLDAHTARLGAAEATISSTSRTVTTLDGKVQSMHTIQAVSIAGNRKALAGISLGSNGGTESSVIVMADKFNVVKNAQDGNITPMFGVVNNKVAVNGDLIADGTISARMMAADSITAGSIQGGAIRANHVAVGELTADKFAVGLGGNLLLNPIFANVNVDDGVPHGWAKGTVNGTVTFGRHTNKNYGLRSMGLPNENCIFIRRTDIGTTNYAELTQVVPVNRRMWYMASVYMGNHRCVKTELIIEYLNANGTAISATHKTGGNGFTGLETAERVFIKFQAPANCEKVRFCLRQTGITARNTNALMLVARPMLEECTAHTRDPSPWQNSGVTAIHGGSIVTRSITAEQIAAKTITADEIASNAIATRHLSAKSINANHIATRTLTADKLNINSLSAISANLGAVTAGSININNRFKVNTSGQVEMRSATANVGMVINNDQIVVYDEQGRVRVKIGRL